MNDRAGTTRDEDIARLDDLFDRAGDARRSVERLQLPFRSMVGTDEAIPPVVLFGSGAWGRFTADRLQRAGMPAIAFVDNAETARGKTVAGLPVLSPVEAASRFARTALFVTTIYNGSAARRQLEILGCTRVLHASAFYYGLPDLFIPYFQLDWPYEVFASRDVIARVYLRWHDDLSRRIFECRLAASLGLPSDPAEPVGVARDTYFDPALMAIRGNDCIVDCGAFDGDTIRQLLRVAGERPARIVALEPDPINATALRSFVAGLDPSIASRIEVVEAAVSASAGEIEFDASGTVGAQAGSGGLRVKTVTLDSLTREGGAPTYIKMDVEGHELEALRGGVALMRDAEPILAISLYHRASDLWQIPTYIAETNAEYRMLLRCYAEDGWESICYAIPSARPIPAEVTR